MGFREELAAGIDKAIENKITITNNQIMESIGVRKEKMSKSIRMLINKHMRDKKVWTYKTIRTNDGKTIKAWENTTITSSMEYLKT